MHLVCEENVFTTPNPYFRRVEVSVFDAENPDRRMIKLAQVVPNGCQSRRNAQTQHGD